MKRIQFIIFLTFFANFILNAEINFEIDYNLPINSSYGSVENVQLLDIDSDDIDEIKIDQINSNSGHTTIFSQSGEILNEFIHLNNDNEKFKQSFAFNENDSNYLICSSSYKSQSADTSYFQLKTYSLLESTLIDSSSILLFTEGELNKVYNIDLVNSGDSKFLYIGIQHYYGNEGFNIKNSYFIVFDFCNGVSTYLDLIEDCGVSFDYYTWSNTILSIGFEEIETFDGYLQICTRNVSFNNILNESNPQVDIIFEISGDFHSSETGQTYHDYPFNYKVVTKNDIHQQEYGSILYYELQHTSFDYEPFTFCYSPSFDEIFYLTQETRLHTSSCINPIIEYQDNYFFVDYYKFSQNQNYLRLFNRINGEMVIEQDCTINCNSIIRASDNKILFLDINNTEINIYSIVGEIVQSTQNEIIESYVNSISNFPNPFNPTTTIDFFIQNDSKTDLIIYNIKGQKVKTLIQSDFSKGSHSITWKGDDENGNSVSSGIYYYKLNINGKTEAINKCLLLK